MDSVKPVRWYECREGDDQHKIQSRHDANRQMSAFCRQHDTAMVTVYDEEAVPGPSVAEIMAFLAAGRCMGTLSDMRDVMEHPMTRELWVNQAFRHVIEREWDTLKKLMKQAGFE